MSEPPKLHLWDRDADHPRMSVCGVAHPAGGLTEAANETNCGNCLRFKDQRDKRTGAEQ